jgi:hypothetical protein
MTGRLGRGELDLVVKGVLGADMGALGIRVDGAEAFKSGQNALWGGEDRNGIRLEACAGRVTGFELALENQGAILPEWPIWQHLSKIGDT